jgi:hypothetical protein
MFIILERKNGNRYYVRRLFHKYTRDKSKAHDFDMETTKAVIEHWKHDTRFTIKKERTLCENDSTSDTAHSVITE